MKKLLPDESPKPKTLRFGSDFSGICSGLIVLKRLVAKLKGYTAHHVHACDNDSNIKKLINHNFKPDHFDTDIKHRDVTMVPTCDVYSFTSPCGSFSAAGKQQGIADSSGQLILEICKFVKHHHPRVIIIENVPTLLYKKNKNVISTIMTCLIEAGYEVESRVINTNEYGLPHHRRRLYMVAISQTHLRKKRCIATFADPLGYTIPLSRLITINPPSTWRAHPEKELHCDNVLKAYKGAVAAGKNPFLDPVVVDMGSSAAFSHYRIGQSPTLTKSRCQTFGYWCSTKGGPLNIQELELLQGVNPGEIDFRGASVRESLYAAALGNAQTLNVLESIMQNAMYNAKLITKGEHEILVHGLSSED